ncbi:hypothetical protein [Cryobacterium sp. BB736]|uniref:hypothetical protein n=1 Tax=Cryobacterium sp. BB736 TaxID=2746963 RepID=UPI0018741DBA|nr:hypothetical protein [Cryobacterium sp. BB736]
MSDTSDSTTLSVTSSTLPGADLLALVRRLIVAAMIAAVVYSALMSGSKGGCPGIVPVSGGRTGSFESTVDVVRSCVNLSLRPSPLVYIALALIVVWAIGAVLRKAHDEQEATRILERAVVIVNVVALGSVLISQVWFWLIPLDNWVGGRTFFYPFPFGVIDLEISPMTTR